MMLRIASRAYEFEVSAKPLSHEGKTRAGLCDHQRGRILISPTVPLELRAEVTALAVSEAWEREVIQRPPIAYVGEVE